MNAQEILATIYEARDLFIRDVFVVVDDHNYRFRHSTIPVFVERSVRLVQEKFNDEIIVECTVASDIHDAYNKSLLHYLEREGVVEQIVFK